jgi:hypothetical protein
VIGATPLGHFIWDETAYLLLDIGFIWNIYLDGEMGLLPHPVAINELDADEDTKTELRAGIDKLLSQPHSDPIQSVDLFEGENARRLVLSCEEGNVVVETSFTDARRSIRVHPLPIINQQAQ